MNTSDAIELFKSNSPIGICDGGPVNENSLFHICAASFLSSHGIKNTIEDNLYTKDTSHLSQYSTIFFETLGYRSRDDDFKKIVSSFSKENLRMVVVGSKEAYTKIENIAKALNINVLYFDYVYPFGSFQSQRENWNNTDNINSVPDLNKIWTILDKEIFFEAEDYFKEIM